MPFIPQQKDYSFIATAGSQIGKGLAQYSEDQAKLKKENADRALEQAKLDETNRRYNKEQLDKAAVLLQEKNTGKQLWNSMRENFADRLLNNGTVKDKLEAQMEASKVFLPFTDDTDPKVMVAQLSHVMNNAEAIEKSIQKNQKKKAEDAQKVIDAQQLAVNKDKFTPGMKAAVDSQAAGGSEKTADKMRDDINEADKLRREEAARNLQRLKDQQTEKNSSNPLASRINDITKSKNTEINYFLSINDDINKNYGGDEDAWASKQTDPKLVSKYYAQKLIAGDTGEAMSMADMIQTYNDKNKNNGKSIIVSGDELLALAKKNNTQGLNEKLTSFLETKYKDKDIVGSFKKFFGWVIPGEQVNVSDVKKDYQAYGLNDPSITGGKIVPTEKKPQPPLSFGGLNSIGGNSTSSLNAFGINKQTTSQPLNVDLNQFVK